MGTWELLHLILPLTRSSTSDSGLCALYSIASRGWFVVGYSAVRICMPATGERDGLAPRRTKGHLQRTDANAQCLHPASRVVHTIWAGIVGAFERRVRHVAPW